VAWNAGKPSTSRAPALETRIADYAVDSGEDPNKVKAWRGAE
jgi:hypothetical protein